MSLMVMPLLSNALKFSAEPTSSTPRKKVIFTLLVIAIGAVSKTAIAQNTAENPANPELGGWQACRALSTDKEARLRCFDDWAKQAGQQPVGATPATPVTSVTPVTPTEPTPTIITMTAPAAHDCHNTQFSEMSRFWELEAGSDCGTFGIRGYKPMSLSWIGSTSVNRQPSSPSAGHTATTAIGYDSNEARIQLSVRTKIAKGLLTQGEALKRDSLWFGYTQQSYWQLFNSTISRPFRSTDHEPEIIYIYPLDWSMPGGWRWRYAGWSLNHQSDGQSLPLSRSWNRNILMAGFENNHGVALQARWWQRIPEAASDDDNPDIADLVGRAELSASWNPNKTNTFGLTWRTALRAHSNGSVRLEWLKALADDTRAGRESGLRFHTQLFSGYGDSLLDYNRRRTVLSVGLSLVDW